MRIGSRGWKTIMCVAMFVGVSIFFVLLVGKNKVFEIRSETVNNESVIGNEQHGGKISPLSGLPCENYNRRPLAVVLAEDPATRPLSGLSEADLVFEMPVITGSITRIVAVYVCNSPKEIGSLRSARHDFIPLSMGLDAVLAHWGGSHFALDLLDAGIMDNIDAIVNPFNAFYRKTSIPQPHNGFTSVERLVSSAEKMRYRMENNFEGYPHIEDSPNEQVEGKKLKIDYSRPYNVEYKYSVDNNSYLRWRAGEPEIDRGNQKQIEAKSIVVMEVFSHQIEGPYYNDLDVEGSGECHIYQNGKVEFCIWEKSASNNLSKLYFLNEDGKEIPFVAGQVWIEIVEPNQKIIWE